MLGKLAMALTLPLLAVAGCAEEALTVGALDPVASVQAVPDAAAEAGSARFELTVAFASSDGALELTATGGFSGERMAMEMDLGGALAGLGGGDAGTLPAGVDEPMQVVVDGTTAYLRLPLLEGLTGTSGWLSVTPDALADVGDLGVMAGTSDPSQLLQALRGVGEVEEVGPEEVRGEPTTRYRATADLTRALEAAPEAQRDQLERLLQGVEAELAEVPFDVWIDGEGRARRVTFDVEDLAGGMLGSAGSATMTLELFDYGEPVEIEVPAADEVTPIGGLLGASGGMG